MENKLYKDIGFVFRQVNLGETDKIISIFSKKHGRIDAIVKGVRKIASRKAGSIDLMNLARFSFAKGTNIDIVTEVTLVDDYQSLKLMLDSDFILFYLCELLDKFLQPEESDFKSFNLLVILLKELSLSQNILLLHSFELKLMANQGFEPNLESCLICGLEFAKEKKRFCSLHDVGLYCAQEDVKHGVCVSDRALKTIRFLARSQIQEASQLEVDKDTEMIIRKVMFTWMEVILEREVLSKKYLQNLS